MKIFKKELDKVAKIYNLGKVKSYKLIKFGLINYNYDVKTEKDSFIIRFIGGEKNEWRRDKLMLSLGILNHLTEKKFPYGIPAPIKRKNGKILSNVNGKKVWVYKKINGEHRKSRDDIQIKEIAKALSTFHKYVKDYKIEKHKQSWDWLIKKYDEMKKIVPKDKIDRLMLENIDFFYDLLKKVSKIKFNDNCIVAHADFHEDNLLFKGDKLTAILDVDTNRWPRIQDIANTMRMACRDKTGKIKLNKMKLFIKEYEKITKLSKKEKDMIIPYMFERGATIFWWMYSGEYKTPEKKYGFLKYTINETKHIVKFVGKRLK